MKFGARVFVKNLCNKSHFGDNRLRDGCTLLNDVMKFLPDEYSPYFLTNVARISCTVCSQGTVLSSWSVATFGAVRAVF
jgi:hypothetical protein